MITHCGLIPRAANVHFDAQVGAGIERIIDLELVQELTVTVIFYNRKVQSMPLGLFGSAE